MKVLSRSWTVSVRRGSQPHTEPSTEYSGAGDSVRASLIPIAAEWGAETGLAAESDPGTEDRAIAGLRAMVASAATRLFPAFGADTSEREVLDDIARCEARAAALPQPISSAPRLSARHVVAVIAGFALAGVSLDALHAITWRGWLAVGLAAIVALATLQDVLLRLANARAHIDSAKSVLAQRAALEKKLGGIRAANAAAASDRERRATWLASVETDAIAEFSRQVVRGRRARALTAAQASRLTTSRLTLSGRGA